jgi:hypothetical protein
MLNHCYSNTKKGEFLDYQFKNDFSIDNTQNRALDMKEMRKFFNKLDLSNDNENRQVSRLDNAWKKWALHSIPGHGEYFTLTDESTLRSNIFPRQSASIESGILINNEKVMCTSSGVKNFEPITVDSNNSMHRVVRRDGEVRFLLSVTNVKNNTAPNDNNSSYTIRPNIRKIRTPLDDYDHLPTTELDTLFKHEGKLYYGDNTANIAG